MESAGISEALSSPTPPAFGYDDTQIHPEGSFIAELIGWRPLDGQRAVWSFRSLPGTSQAPLSREPLRWITGTVCRPDNHLSRLVLALRIVSGVQTPDDLQQPSSRQAIQEALAALEPETLIGRRCRIEVEHVRDEVGDPMARIKSVAPLE